MAFDATTAVTIRSFGSGAGATCVSDSSQAPVDTAFAALLAQQRTDLLRFACWLCGDRHLGEEIVQEAMLRAWNARLSLKKDGSLRSWLLTIVRREHARVYERKRLPTISLDEALQETEPAMTQSDDEQLDELRRAILRLPEMYREPLLMQVIYGYSTDQIAQETGLTQSTVLTRLFRARNTLREIYTTADQPARGPS
jgi:RNA polymerase sigma-70 factor (ECF subfamily)